MASKRQKMRWVRMRVKGQIDPTWSEWFHDLAITYVEEADETLLSGMVVDQAALYGLLARLRDIGLALIAVESEELDEKVRGPRRRRSTEKAQRKSE